MAKSKRDMLFQKLKQNDKNRKTILENDYTPIADILPNSTDLKDEIINIEADSNDKKIEEKEINKNESDELVVTPNKDQLSAENNTLNDNNTKENQDNNIEDNIEPILPLLDSTNKNTPMETSETSTSDNKPAKSSNLSKTESQTKTSETTSTSDTVETEEIANVQTIEEPKPLELITDTSSCEIFDVVKNKNDLMSFYNSLCSSPEVLLFKEYFTKKRETEDFISFTVRMPQYISNFIHYESGLMDMAIWTYINYIVKLEEREQISSNGIVIPAIDFKNRAYKSDNFNTTSLKLRLLPECRTFLSRYGAMLNMKPGTYLCYIVQKRYDNFSNITIE